MFFIPLHYAKGTAKVVFYFEICNIRRTEKNKRKINLNKKHVLLRLFVFGDGAAYVAVPAGGGIVFAEIA